MFSSTRFKFIVASALFVATASALADLSVEPPFSNDDIISHSVMKRQVVVESAVIAGRGNCTDENENCRRWAKRNYCTHPDFERYMSLKCRRSCYFCEIEEPEEKECSDQRDACKYWKDAGYCTKEKYRKFMAVKCPRSCGFCPAHLTTEATIAATTPTEEATTTVSSTEEPIEETTAAEFSEWGEWSSCSQSCGGGSMRRSRECLLDTCTSMQVKSCGTDPCPTTTTTIQTTTAVQTTTSGATTVESTTRESTVAEAATDAMSVVESTSYSEKTAEKTTTAWEETTYVEVTTSLRTEEATTSMEETTADEVPYSETTTVYEIESTATSATVAETTATMAAETTANVSRTTEDETTAKIMESITSQPEATTAEVTTELAVDTTAQSTLPESTFAQQTSSSQPDTTTSLTSASVTVSQSSAATAETTVSVEFVTTAESTSAETTVSKSQEVAFTQMETTAPTTTTDFEITTSERQSAESTPSTGKASIAEQETEVSTVMTSTVEDREETTGAVVYTTISEETTALTTVAPVASESTSTVVTTSVTDGEECRDNANSCSLMLFSCETSQFTRTYCRATCGLCQSPQATSTTVRATTASETTTDEPITTTSAATTTTGTQATSSTSYEITTAVQNATVETTPQTTVGTSPAPWCKDRLTTCKYFLFRGCTSAVMRAFCKATCNLCETAATTAATATTSSVVTLTSSTSTSASSEATTTPSPPPETTSVYAFVSTDEDATEALTTTSSPLTSVTTTSGMTSSTEQTTTKACVDLYEECANISIYCGTVANVTNSCPRTCGVCSEGEATEAPATVPTEVCEDSFPNCDDLLEQCHDEEATTYLRVTCRRTCGFCVVATTANPTTTPEPTTAAVLCVDENEKCADWSRYGLCNSTIYPEMMDYMQGSCKNSCGLCGDFSWSEWSSCSLTCGGGEQSRDKLCDGGNCSEPVTERRSCNVEACPATQKCLDGMTTKACMQYKEKNACLTTLGQALCAKTCGVCTDGSENATAANQTDGVKSNTTSIGGNSTCEDTHELCGNWSGRGFCQNTYTTYMKQNCPRSCGFCSVWNAWGPWSPCNATCAGGVMHRNRTCKAEDCHGPTNETANCNTFKCSTCFDQSPTCAILSQAGKCSETFWKFLCRKSCNLCTPEPITGPCHDTRTDCETLKAGGRCAEQIVGSVCPRTCERCPSYQETTGQCIDGNPNCPAAATMGRCTDPRVKSICPLSCKACTRQDESQGEEGRTLTVDSAANGCADRNALCPRLVANCANNTVVADTCRKTCGNCEEACVDKDELCPKLAEAGQCKIAIVTTECPLSCQACPKKSQTTKKNTDKQDRCEDKLGSCPKLVELLNCTNQMVIDSCAKTCGKCVEPVTTVAPAVVEKKEEECVDQNPECPALAEQGKCEQMFYIFLCRKSCRRCDEREATGVPEACADRYPSATCRALNACDNPLIAGQCERTCKLCEDFVCRDSIPGTCRTLASIGMCSQGSFQRRCPVTCKLCGEGSGATAVVGTTTAVVSQTTCMDERSDCHNFFRAGHCRHEVIESVCRKTCQVCHSPTAILDPDAPCIDSSSTCALFARMNQCRSTRNVRFMCAKSCDYCPRIDSARKTVVPATETQCRDSNPICRQLSAACSTGQVAISCPLTCGKCKAVDQEGMSSNGQRPAGFNKCRDFLPDCPDFSSLCARSSPTDYIPTMCPSTCHTCGLTTLAPGKKPTEAPAVTTTTADVTSSVATSSVATSTDATSSVSTATQGAPAETGEFTKWGTWTQCSKTCGGGIRTRNRTCVSDACTGSLVDSGACAKDLCGSRHTTVPEGCSDASPLCGRWLQNSTARCTSVRYREQMKFQCAFSCGHCTPKLKWSQWSPCSAPCGGGSQNRTRSCEVEGECGGQAGNGEFEKRDCNTEDCGTWTSWKEWTPCSVTCGQGHRSRERFCPSGRIDDCEGSPTEQEPCDVNVTCPGWGNWSNWTDCSASCGGGVTSRSRDCYPGAENVTCSGNGTEEMSCNEQQCPEWTEWGPWTECSVTCGQGGTSSRSRECSVEGQCQGLDVQTRNCSSNASCIHWSEWSAYSDCSASCGGGVATRNRTCIGGAIGSDECPGHAEQTLPCNWQICPDVGLWAKWGEFGACSKTCGGGKMQRIRVCLNGIPGAGGCPGSGKEKVDCAVEDCPVGWWSEWSQWSGCSSSCGVGIKSRDRQCIEGEAGLSGCPGQKESVGRCNEHLCPTWTSWQSWTQCSASCGTDGERTRVKACFDSSIGKTVPSSQCSDSKETLQKERCNVRSCPVWAKWSGWGPCSASCGVGESLRTRRCQNGTAGDLGCHIGGIQDKRYCNQWDCPRVCETEPIAASAVFDASSYVRGYRPMSVELATSGAWCPSNNDEDQWLQIDFANPVVVSGIEIRGFLNDALDSEVPNYSWVSEFAVERSNSFGEFEPIKNNARERKVFKGPEGPMPHHARSRFWNPVAAKSWRIRVLSSFPHQQGCMKIQLLQCKDAVENGSGSFV